MALQSNTLVQVSLDGVDLGTWMTKTGGEFESDVISIRPGGGAPKLVLGGINNVTEVTVTTYYRPDLRERSKWMVSRLGKGKATVSVTTLDADNNPLSSTVYTGLLSGVTLPEADSESNDMAGVELRIEPHGTIG